MILRGICFPQGAEVGRARGQMGVERGFKRGVEMKV